MRARKAFVGIKTDPHYRRDAFESGLRSIGFEIVSAQHFLGEGDVAVFWNLHAGWTEPEADALKNRGVAILVAENGYYGSDREGRQLYALARDGHNGSGRWVADNKEVRPGGFGVCLPRATPPARQRGAQLLIAGQRGIGSSLMASPPGWHKRVADELEGAGIACFVRPHPGADSFQKSLADQQIAESSGVVIWSSGLGVRALMLGRPVWYAAPHWVGAAGANRYAGPVSIGLPDKTADQIHEALRLISWAQWSVEEIASGSPFDLLLQGPDGNSQSWAGNPKTWAR